MKIPGFLKDNLFYLKVLAISSVLSTSLQIYKTVASTLEGNTSGHLELQKVRNEK